MANYSSNGPLRLQSNGTVNAGYMSGSSNEAYTILLGHAAGNAGRGETYVSERNANNFMAGWAAGIENGNYQPVLFTTTGINFNVNHSGGDNNGKWVSDSDINPTHVAGLLNHYEFSSYYDLDDIKFPLQIFLYADYSYYNDSETGRERGNYSDNALDVKIQYQNTDDDWVDFSGSLTGYDPDSNVTNLVTYINDAHVTAGGYDIGGSDAPTDISNNNYFRVVFKANGGVHPYPKVIIKSSPEIKRTSGNFFSGYFAGQSNTGYDNIAIGSGSLQYKASGNGNIALGVNAGDNRHVNPLTYYSRDGENVTTYTELHTQHPHGLTNCTMIGANTGFDISSGVNVSYSNSVALGASARITASNQIVLGTANETVSIPGNLYVNGSASGSSDWTTSDDRLKHNETDISNALQHIRELHPQHYIKTGTMYEADHMFTLDICGQPIDSSGNAVDHFIEEGLIAQDLLRIDVFKPFVRVPDNDKTPYAVNYNSIFVHSLKALQELDIEHTKTKTELEQTKQSLTETISNLESLLQSALSRITALETQSTSS